MQRHRHTWLAGAILAGIVFLSTSSAAEAQFRLRVEDVGLGVGIVITDNGFGDLDLTPGIIISAGSVGSFTFTLAVGASKPIISGLDLSFTATTLGAGTIRVTLEDTGYTGLPDGELLLRSTVSGEITGGSIVLNSWVDPMNAVPALGFDTFGLILPVPPIGAIPGTSVAAWPGNKTSLSSSPEMSDATWMKSGPYSLFTQATITFGAQGGTVTFSDNQTVAVIPAPGGLVLALAALPVFGFSWLRRRWRKAQALCDFCG